MEYADGVQLSDYVRHGPQPPPAGRRPLDPAGLQQAERDLAVYVGPLARMLVRQAAPMAANLTELYDCLAGHIQGQAGRRAFLH